MPHDGSAQALQMGASFSCTLTLIYLMVQTPRQTGLVPHFPQWMAMPVPASPAAYLGTERKQIFNRTGAFHRSYFYLPYVDEVSIYPKSK